MTVSSSALACSLACPTPNPIKIRSAVLPGTALVMATWSVAAPARAMPGTHASAVMPALVSFLISADCSFALTSAAASAFGLLGLNAGRTSTNISAGRGVDVLIEAMLATSAVAQPARIPAQLPNVTVIAPIVRMRLAVGKPRAPRQRLRPASAAWTASLQWKVSGIRKIADVSGPVGVDLRMRARYIRYGYSQCSV